MKANVVAGKISREDWGSKKGFATEMRLFSHISLRRSHHYIPN
jgi:hypothetical protein